MIPYSEDRCALNGPLVFSAIVWPAAVLVFVVAFAVTGDPLLWLPAVAGIFGLVYTMAPVMLMMSRRVSIRVDTDGIRIGNVRSAPGHGGPRQAVPPQAQRTQVFAAPWGAIQRAEVVTGRRELRKLRRVGQDIGLRRAAVVSVGRLWSPQMRAALVLNVDVERVHWPEFLPYGEARRTRLGTATNRTSWRHSPVWLAPTRHPEELRRALTQAGVPRPDGARER